MNQTNLPIARINPATLDLIGEDSASADVFSVERDGLGMVDHRIVRSDSVPAGEAHLDDGSVLDLSDIPQA